MFILYSDDQGGPLVVSGPHATCLAFV